LASYAHGRPIIACGPRPGELGPRQVRRIHRSSVRTNFRCWA
jgi:hypothetical protein